MLQARPQKREYHPKKMRKAMKETTEKKIAKKKNCDLSGGEANCLGRGGGDKVEGKGKWTCQVKLRPWVGRRTDELLKSRQLTPGHRETPVQKRGKGILAHR